MKNFFKNFFNDPTTILIVDTLIILSIVTGVFYLLTLLYKY